jgi:TonB-linked SusC/RagA family outer membrane protein
MLKKLLMLVLAVFCITSAAYSQSGTLSGTITDSNTGETLPAVNVVISEIMKGASTDMNGEYLIEDIPLGTYTIEVTFVGYLTITQSINVNAGTNLVNFEMSTDIGLLDEIVVSGVADATPRKKLTVSVAKVDAAQLSKVPATSITGALAGKVSGVKIQATSGAPGGVSDIQVRSDNNLNVTSNPLVVVDGVLVEGGLSGINTEDVASMEIVKGAAASSLYGSRAGNGVLVVTTKRGNLLEDGAIDITVRQEVGFSDLPKHLDLSNSHFYELDDPDNPGDTFTRYAGVTYPDGYQGGFHPDISGSRTGDADHYMDNPFAVNNDIQDQFFQTGQTMTNYFALASRVGDINLFTSFENNDQEGIIPNTDGFNRRNFRVNTDWQVNDWLKISTSNLAVRTTSNTPGGGNGLFFDLVLAEPDNNIFMDHPVDGKFNPTGEDNPGQPYYIRHNQWSNEENPLYNTWVNTRNTYGQRFLGNYQAIANVTDWLEFKGSYSIENNQSRYSSYYPYWQWTVGGDNPWGITYTEGQLIKDHSETQSENIQLSAISRFQYGKLNTKITASYLYEDLEYDSFFAQGFDFKIQDVPDFDAMDASDISADNFGYAIRAENYYGVISLDYDDKYLVDALIRQDGSSLFGSQQRWNTYYRVSGAYRITEDFDLGFFDELKIRAAQGTAGIRPEFSWQYETFSLTQGTASKDQLGNKDLKPSETKETEFAISGTFMKNYSFELIYANSVTKNQFLNVPLLPLAGFSSQYQNAGTLEGNTLEFNFQANILNSKDLSWNMGLTWATSESKITKLSVPPYQSGPDGLFYIKEGETYGAIYGYDWVRSLDVMANQLTEGESIDDYELNNEGYVIPTGTQGTPDEKPVKLRDEFGNLAFVKIGDGRPDWTAGFSNTISYKDFSLYLLFDFKSGGDLYNRKSQWLTRDDRNGIMDQAGKPENEKKAYDYYKAFYDVNTNNSYWVEDASFIKLRELSISYRVSPNNLGKVLGTGYDSIVLSVIGRNLLTFTDYSGYDPEAGTIRSPFDGTDQYPNMRNIAFSIGINF